MSKDLRRVLIFGISALLCVVAVSGIVWHLKKDAAIDISSKVKDGYSVVITGDSLSFNAFEFDSMSPLLPADYAYKNPYGLASWGHMTRDSIYASAKGFRLADIMTIEVSPGIVPYGNVNGPYTAPFNGRLTTFIVPDSSGSITLKGVGGKEPGAARLMFLTGASDFTNIARFDIYSNGLYRRSVSLKGDDRYYRGRYQLNVDGIPVEAGGDVVIKNIVPMSNDGSPAAVQIIGVSLAEPVVHMTGHGMWTSQQVLDDFENMVAQYKPDLLFYQIGANDMALSVPIDSFKAHVESFIQQVRAIKPGADIVLVSTTPSQYFPEKNAFSSGYLEAIKELSDRYNCQFVDLYDVLSGVSHKKWRHDDVHASIKGGQLIYNEVRGKVFPGINLKSGYRPDAKFQVRSSAQ